MSRSFNKSPECPAGWPDQLVEMRDHIGEEATLALVEWFGGSTLYLSKRANRRLIDCLGEPAAKQLSRIYAGERITVPCARYLLARSRRAELVRKARNGAISITGAAKQLGTSRTYMSYLVNRTNEGR